MPGGKTKKAIVLTRELLCRALYDPYTMMIMVRDEISPEDVEDKIRHVLKYLEKTAEVD